MTGFWEIIGLKGGSDIQDSGRSFKWEENQYSGGGFKWEEN